MQSRFRGIPSSVLPLVLVACTPGSDDTRPALTAATLGEQTVRAPSAYLAEPRYADADPVRGERLALACRACHSLGPEGRSMIGPPLFGMFGREAGSREDFEYSTVLATADFRWTPRALEAWLAAPASFLPGNRMSFAGVGDEEDRRDLVAYLLTATSVE